MISVDAGTYVWFSFLVLFLPLDLVLSAVSAAVFHEACHVLLLKLLRGKIVKIRLSVRGCEIESTSPGDWQSLLSILAGPVGSLSLLLLRRSFPKIALCGLFQGLYNLLPLDGGRALSLLLDRVSPQKTEHILLWTGRIVCGFLAAVIIWWEYLTYVDALSACLALFWIMKMLPRKIPCKPSQIGVQ